MKHNMGKCAVHSPDAGGCMSKNEPNGQREAMAMSANILREIVSRVLKVDSRKVVLAGEIDPQFAISNDDGHSWWSGAEWHSTKLYGFSPETGLVLLDIGAETTFSQNGSPRYYGQAEPLVDYLVRTGKATEFVFFVSDTEGKEYGEEGREYRTVTLYKAADFPAKWAAIQSEETSRWEEWLNTIEE